MDSSRIYLGGHSTGGTLVLLTAEMSNRFRAIFSFGPVANVNGYGRGNLTFDTANRKEFDLRAPIKWLEGIHSTTFVFEGDLPSSNIGSVLLMMATTANASINFRPVKGVDHFAILAPVTGLVARKIVEDKGAGRILISNEEIKEAVEQGTKKKEPEEGPK